MDRDRIKRYLLSELFWELDQHDPRPAVFRGVELDQVEVIDFVDYDQLSIKIKDSVFDICLSWQKFKPPTITEVDRESPSAGCHTLTGL